MIKTNFKNSKFLPLEIVCKNLFLHGDKNVCKQFSMVKTSNFQKLFYHSIPETLGNVSCPDTKIEGIEVELNRKMFLLTVRRLIVIRFEFIEV